MRNTVIEMPAKNPHGINGKIKFGHVGLWTEDFEATKNWYIDTLGFRLLKQFENVDLQLELAYIAPANDDDVWIEVLMNKTARSNQGAPHPITSGFQHICLEVENVNETLRVLREKGVKIVREPFDMPVIGKRIGFAADLFGNVLEFAENI